MFDKAGKPKRKVLDPIGGSYLSSQSTGVMENVSARITSIKTD